jgi:hypothetical protein
MNRDMNDDWFRRLLAASDDAQDARERAFQEFENAGLVNRIVVARYSCRRRGCVLATVVRIGDQVLCRTRDYKLAPGTNLARSVESARAKNTIDGQRHWPGHTFDVTDLAAWGDQAGVDMNCRHGLRTVLARDVLAAVEGRNPGHPGAPLRV